MQKPLTPSQLNQLHRNFYQQPPGGEAATPKPQQPQQQKLAYKERGEDKGNVYPINH